jgi:hypothetical protein
MVSIIVIHVTYLVQAQHSVCAAGAAGLHYNAFGANWPEHREAIERPGELRRVVCDVRSVFEELALQTYRCGVVFVHPVAARIPPALVCLGLRGGYRTTAVAETVKPTRSDTCRPTDQIFCVVCRGIG